MVVSEFIFYSPADRPGNFALDHTPDEHMVLAEYHQAVEVLQSALKAGLKFWNSLILLLAIIGGCVIYSFLLKRTEILYNRNQPPLNHSAG